MEFTQEMIFKPRFAGKMVKKTEFAETVGGVQLSALSYAMDNGLVDYVRVGRERLVLLTENTLKYRPNKSKTRPVKRKAIMQTGK